MVGFVQDAELVIALLYLREKSRLFYSRNLVLFVGHFQESYWKREAEAGAGAGAARKSGRIR